MKDAVSSLRNDMMDITSRINEIEERLNRMTQLQFQQKVMTFTNFDMFVIIIFFQLTLLILLFLIPKYPSLEKC